jgi:hypothetical protein
MIETTKKLSPEQREIMYQIALLANKQKLQPVTAVFPNNQKIFMERIYGTTKYLAHNRKVIYDVSFKDLYNMGKIANSCFAVDHFLYNIDAWASIEEPDQFKKILLSPLPLSRGTRFYLDDELFMENVSFIKADMIRNELIWERRAGTRWFNVLKIIDPSGNETLFFPPARVSLQHKMKEHVRNK